LKNVIERRIIEEARFVINTLSTIRSTAKEFGVSKSTTHKDLSERLKEMSPQLYSEVNKVMQINMQERNLRGGEATRRKYKNMVVAQ